MSGFGCAPVIAPPPAAPAEEPIVNDGWLPDIDVAAQRLQLRLKDAVTPDRLRRALVGAVITVNNQLAAWQATQIAAGYANLAAVPSSQVDPTDVGAWRGWGGGYGWPDGCIDGRPSRPPAPSRMIEIDGTNRLVLLYARAVGSYAKAELVETYRDVDLTGAGERKVDEVAPSIGELRRDGLYAVRDIIGATRTRVALI